MTVGAFLFHTTCPKQSPITYNYSEITRSTTCVNINCYQYHINIALIFQTQSREVAEYFSLFIYCPFVAIESPIQGRDLNGICKGFGTDLQGNCLNEK